MGRGGFIWRAAPWRKVRQHGGLETVLACAPTHMLKNIGHGTRIAPRRADGGDRESGYWVMAGSHSTVFFIYLSTLALR